MKIVKNMLLTLAAIVIIILVLAAIVPSDFEVEREVTINRSNTEVFEYTKYLKNQEKFSVWAKMDPNMKREFTGVDGTAGFISAWESDNPDVGKGEQEITKVYDGKRIDYQLRFLEPFESTSNAYMIFNGLDSITTSIKWGFEGGMPYPMNIMLLFMNIEEDLGAQLATGLTQLKTILEKIPAELGKKVAELVNIPVIGIGAGGHVDGQVLVMHDLLGVTKEFNPRFLRRYLNLYEEIKGAVENYISDVKSQDFPNESEQY